MQFIGIFPKCFVPIRSAGDLHHKTGGLSRCGIRRAMDKKGKPEK
jgi:hypothetical protein